MNEGQSHKIFHLRFFWGIEEPLDDITFLIFMDVFESKIDFPVSKATGNHNSIVLATLWSWQSTMGGRSKKMGSLNFLVLVTLGFSVLGFFRTLGWTGWSTFLWLTPRCCEHQGLNLKFDCILYIHKYETERILVLCFSFWSESMFVSAEKQVKQKPSSMKKVVFLLYHTFLKRFWIPCSFCNMLLNLRPIS